MTQPDRNPLEKTFQQKIDPGLIFRASEIHNLNYREEINVLLKLYLSEIEYTDYAVGQLIDRLEAANLRSRTIVIVTADHGENLVEHWEMNQFFRHGSLTFETETRVPFIVSFPGIIPSGKRVQQIASHVDIFPTLLNLIGAGSLPKTDGVSLVPDLLEDRPALHRPIFSEASMPYLDWQREARHVGWLNERNSASMRLGDYKYLSMPLRNYEAIFKVAIDRAEEQNLLQALSKQNPGLFSALRNGLQNWRAKLSTGEVDTTFELSESDQEKLEALGYIQ
jgi:arylsulfatase A-like enzyme